jgi:tetratricopeptide (TPR) repeat protein
LGIVFAEMDRIDEAVFIFQQAIRLNLEVDQPYFNLGRAYLRQGQFQEAREMFETALRKNP